MDKYLEHSEHIDWRHELVSAKAAELARGCETREEVVARAYRFVRDDIRHSLDSRPGPVTCRASDVLRHATGYCYAKSHLLAALLRARGIPAGLCYQRLAVEQTGPPFCLHGLNAVLLGGLGWFRLDARGNKPGIDADFCPPQERLAYAATGPGEADLPEVWPKPLPVVVRALTEQPTVEAVYRNLPDVDFWK